MSRKDYSNRDFMGVRALNLANPILASDVANRGYIDGIAAGAAADAQPRLAATGAAITIPNGVQTTITNWSVTVNRSMAYNAGNITTTVAGVYVISFSGNLSASIASGVRGFVTIYGTTSGTYYLSSIGAGEAIGTATAVLGMNAGEGVIAAVYQASGTARTWTGIFNIVRVSAI